MYDSTVNEVIKRDTTIIIYILYIMNIEHGEKCCMYRHVYVYKIK